MANLSNINNKFLVTTGGNIGIGDTGPTRSLSILRSEAVVNVKSSGVSGHSMIILDHASSANNYSQVRFSNAGSAKFAIGIDPQDSYKLKIVNDGNATGANTRMTITTGGDVGIGTTSPPSDHKLQIHNAGAAYARFALTNTSTGVASADGLIFQMETLNSIIKNQEAGYLTFGTSGRETDLKIDSSGNSTFGGTVTTTDVYGTSSLRLAALGGTAYLDATTDVLIRTNGTTTALTLDSSQNATFAGNVKVNGANSLLIRDDGTFIKEDQGLQIGNTSGTGTTRPIRFFTESTERMRIDSSGNVGIGTSDIDFELQVGGTDVSGTANFTSQFAVLSEATTGYPSGFIFKAPRVATSSNRVLLNEDFGTYFSSQVHATSTAGAQSDTPIVFAPQGGNVGIGTTSPTGFRLVVENTAEDLLKLHNSTDGLDSLISFTNPGGTLARIQGVDNGGLQLDTGNNAGGINTNAMFIDNAGNVGINTTSPSHKLHVIGDQLIFGDLLLEGSANSFRTVSMNTSDGSDNQTLSLCGGATASSARGGRVEIKGNEADGSVVLVAGNVSTGDIDFYTANSQRMIINNAGNVGIGTDAPTANLQIGLNPDPSQTAESLVHLLSTTASSTVNGFSHLKLDYHGGAAPSSAGAQIMFNQSYHSGNTDYTQPTGSIRGWKTGADYNYGGGLQLLYQPDAGALGVLVGMTLTGGGNVGIGTDVPAKPLHVIGEVRFDNDLTLQTTRKLYLDGGNDTYITEVAANEIAFNTGGSEKMRIETDAVGINTTTPYSRFVVNGCLTIGDASSDGNVSSTASGASVTAAGSIHLVQGYIGSMSSGDTCVFTYSATVWKSWILEYTFASTNGITSGVCGGYNNASTGNSNQVFIDNLGMSYSFSLGGPSNQSNIITFTFTSPGTHPIAKLTYSQGGGDGIPLGSKTELYWSS